MGHDSRAEALAGRAAVLSFRSFYIRLLRSAAQSIGLASIVAVAYLHLSGDKPPLMPNLRDFSRRIVPEGHVFVMGDSRWASHDSRAWGVVPVENMVGKASLIFWSREHALTPPTRQNPNVSESWGNLRWDRFGRLVK